MPYKKQDKAGDWVDKVQSVLGEDAKHLKRVIVVWKSLLQKFIQHLFSNCCLLLLFNNNEKKKLETSDRQNPKDNTN